MSAQITHELPTKGQRVARTRYIKPEFFEDAKIAKISHSARLLFIGLWTLMDRQGLTETTEPAIIRARLFAFDEVTSKQVQGWLDELVIAGRVLRIHLKGQDFLFCPNLKRHQWFHRNEVAKYPFTDEEVQVAVKNCSSTVLEQTLNRSSTTVMVTVMGTRTAAPNGASGLFPSLVEVYNRYPRKKGKQEGLDRLRKTVTSEADLADLNRALDNYLAEIRRDKTEMKHVKFFSTFVGPVEQPAWRDYLEPDAVPGSAPQKLKTLEDLSSETEGGW